METPHIELDDDLKAQLVAWRRDFHRYAEPGWTEFRTTAVIVQTLRELGWQVAFGPDIHVDSERLGVPDPAVLQAARERAIHQGADPDLVAHMGEGLTGAVALLDTGRPGPTVGFRFDIDCNDLNESAEQTHRPTAEGFASVNPGAMHGCGHDGHAAMGLGLAAVLADRVDDLNGRVKIVFQPAEEGVRGAHSLAAAGVVDDVDLFLATHLAAAEGLGTVFASSDNYLASTKFDVAFTGVGSHAGGDPERGRNALLAAAQAVLGLHAIPRHSGGDSRINVGTLSAGEGRNVVPRMAHLRAETRGVNSRVNDFMFESAQRIVAGAAQMQGVDAELTVTGHAGTAQASPELLPYVHAVFAHAPGVTRVRDSGGGSGSEDATALMNRVQDRGGLATYVQLGMDTPWGHHTEDFDVDESALPIGVAAEAALALGAGVFLRSLGR